MFLLLSVSTAIGLPRQIAAFSAGYFFTFAIGVTLATLATTMGCLITYLASQHGLYQIAEKKFPAKVKSIQTFLSEATFVKALVIRILPLGSNFLTNIVAGATKTPLIPYVSGSFIGFIPQMVLFALIGSGVSISAAQQNQLTLWLGSFALGLILWLIIRHKKRAV